VEFIYDAVSGFLKNEFHMLLLKCKLEL
jgi:hypothetical protein